MIIKSGSKKLVAYEVDPYSMTCTCPAGKYRKGGLCRHLKAIFNGEIRVEPVFNPKLFERQKEPLEYTSMTKWRSDELWKN